MSTIDDGGGKNGKAQVDTEQRLEVSGSDAPRDFHASRKHGLAFSAIYATMTVAAGEDVAYLKNDHSTKNIHIGEITVSGVPEGKWWVKHVTGVAAAGAAVTPTNVNLSKGIPAEATAMSGDTAITGLTDVNIITVLRHVANDQVSEDFDGGLILGPGDAIALEYNTGAGGLVDADIHFHYEDIV